MAIQMALGQKRSQASSPVMESVEDPITFQAVDWNIGWVDEEVEDTPRKRRRLNTPSTPPLSPLSVPSTSILSSSPLLSPPHSLSPHASTPASSRSSGSPSSSGEDDEDEDDEDDEDDETSSSGSPSSSDDSSDDDDSDDEGEVEAEVEVDDEDLDDHGLAYDEDDDDNDDSELRVFPAFVATDEDIAFGGYGISIWNESDASWKTISYYVGGQGANGPGSFDLDEVPVGYAPHPDEPRAMRRMFKSFEALFGAEKDSEGC